MVTAGRVAIVHLTGRLVDGPDVGAVFETTDVDVALDEGVYHDHRDFKPLEFRVGEGHVLPGIDRAVQDMEAGETRTVELAPEEAFGPRNEDAVIRVPRGEIEARSDSTAEVDQLVRSDTGEVGWITDVGEDEVTIDFNHELAGECVEFEIRLLNVHAADTAREGEMSNDEVA